MLDIIQKQRHRLQSAFHSCLSERA
jgi:hypothetical protein